MERLTERLSNGQVAVYGCGSNCKHAFRYCHNHLEDCPTINEIYEELAAYEDIGLTPEQLREIDKLYAEKCKELAELEKRSFSGIEMVKIWAKLKKLKEYEELEKQGKLEKIPCMSEEKYTIEQIIDAIIQSYDEIVCAVQMEDRSMLEDVLKDYLHC